MTNKVTFLRLCWPRDVAIFYPACRTDEPPGLSFRTSPHGTTTARAARGFVFPSNALGYASAYLSRVETNTIDSSSSSNHVAPCSTSTTDFGTHAKMVIMIRLAPNAGSVLRWPPSAQTRYCDLFPVLKGRITSVLGDVESPSSKCVHARSCIDMDRGSRLG